MSKPPPAEALPTPREHKTRSRARPGGIAVEKVAGRPFRERKPPWLKVPAPGGPKYRELKKQIHGDRLHTVCEEANESVDGTMRAQAEYLVATAAVPG